MYYNYFKALHIIFVITWFAGLFYIPRLFIYHLEAQKMEEPKRSILSDQFKLMSRRLWNIITWPSAILAIIFALLLLILMPEWLTQSWMIVKLSFVIGLIFYHLKTHQMYKQMQQNVFKHSETFMRFWNEGATLLLFAIVFLVALKNTLQWWWGILGIVVLGFLLYLGIKAYKKTVKNSKN